MKRRCVVLEKVERPRYQKRQKYSGESREAVLAYLESLGLPKSAGQSFWRELQSRGFFDENGSATDRDLTLLSAAEATFGKEALSKSPLEVFSEIAQRR